MTISYTCSVVIVVVVRNATATRHLTSFCKVFFSRLWLVPTRRWWRSRPTRRAKKSFLASAISVIKVSNVAVRSRNRSRSTVHSCRTQRNNNIIRSSYQVLSLSQVCHIEIHTQSLITTIANVHRFGGQRARRRLILVTRTQRRVGSLTESQKDIIYK